LKEETDEAFHFLRHFGSEINEKAAWIDRIVYFAIFIDQISENSQIDQKMQKIQKMQKMQKGCKCSNQSLDNLY
jgi:cell fate (sporulation/competence/biofilm development) regulator YmcA (YheA/YmcA/DUF963 family)